MVEQIYKGKVIEMDEEVTRTKGHAIFRHCTGSVLNKKKLHNIELDYIMNPLGWDNFES